MNKLLTYLRHSLVSKLIFSVGLIVVLSISSWAYFNIKSIKTEVMKNVISGTDRLVNSIKLGTQYAMMLNSRDDITQIIKNIATQPGIETIRIYNKDGQIKFTNKKDEIDRVVDIKEVACDICHQQDPPPASLGLEQRTRFFNSGTGGHFLGIVQPICNEPGCTGSCHFHPEHQKILGSLDMVISLENVDAQILNFERGILVLSLSTILITSIIIFISILQFVKKPIIKLIDGTRKIAQGQYHQDIDIGSDSEIAPLAEAIKQMGNQIGQNQRELKRQRNEYQLLFETAPCMITVQDRDYRLLRWNKVFQKRFDPEPGSHCYMAYKGLEEKCSDCPVDKTFKDGKSHYGEAEGIGRDGEKNHWIFITSPITSTNGEITAAIEMSIDITQRKHLEKELQQSEEKYHAIFNNISNPVFVVARDTFRILDCNNKAIEIHGLAKKELVKQHFHQLFPEPEQQTVMDRMTSGQEISKAEMLIKDGVRIFVDMWISPSIYSDREVFLVTVSDITQRLETEQHLMHASKMATLGEMSTGIAHELNQPLSVIKSASSFCIKKIDRQEWIEKDVFEKLMMKIDANVDRAEKIIHHMRQFARKSDVRLVRTDINAVIQRTFEMFNQQLKIHGIHVAWDRNEDLPDILGDPDRLEQVFINLIINAKDAIEEKWAAQGGARPDETDQITILTREENRHLEIEVHDTGTGIPKEVAEKVFEPFFTTKEVGKGTGLGLSISYGIIRDCGGDIHIAPLKAGGTGVFISLPVPDHFENDFPFDRGEI